VTPEKTPSADAPLSEEELFVLEAGRRMSLRNRLLWLEEMHELVLRWSKKRPMMYPDGTVIGPETGHVAEGPTDASAASDDKKSSAENL
jgi:hypothetical protein